MKKIFYLLLLAVIPAFVTAQSAFKVTPNDGKIVWGIDFSTTPVIDTNFPFQVTGAGQSGYWSSHAKWIDVDTTGTIHLEVSDFGLVNWEPYYDSLAFQITDTTGSDALEDNMWNWKYGNFHLIFDDTVNTGQLYIIFYPIYR
jgi:hypothetical protein